MNEQGIVYFSQAIRERLERRPEYMAELAAILFKSCTLLGNVGRYSTGYGAIYVEYVSRGFASSPRRASRTPREKERIIDAFLYGADECESNVKPEFISFDEFISQNK